MESDTATPPFWSQSTTEILHHRRRRSQSSPPLINPVVLILLIPILILFILFLIIPPFITQTSRILKPSYSVKKSWDSLNIFLVLFAIICGFLAKKNDEVPASGSTGTNRNEQPVLNGSSEPSFQKVSSL